MGYCINNYHDFLQVHLIVGICVLTGSFLGWILISLLNRTTQGQALVHALFMAFFRLVCKLTEMSSCFKFTMSENQGFGDWEDFVPPNFYFTECNEMYASSEKCSLRGMFLCRDCLNNRNYGLSVQSTFRTLNN